jgi:hypothetical protein
VRVYYSELCLIGGSVESNVDKLIAHGAENVELMLDGEGWNDFHLCMDELAATLVKKTYWLFGPCTGMGYESDQRVRPSSQCRS